MASFLNDPELDYTPQESASDTQDDNRRLFNIVVEGKNKKYVCTISDCQKVFRFHSEIMRHMASHSSSRPHRCTFDGCDKEFKRPTALENHIRSQHTGEAPLLCPNPGCGLRFSTESKYRYHLISHMDEKPFKCPYPHCNKAFMTASQLKQHERSPTVHKKIDLLYKLEETNLKKDPLNLEISDDLLKIDETGLGSNKEPAKKIKYDVQNQKLSLLLSSLQSKSAEEIKTSIEQKSSNAPALEHVLLQNDLLRKKLESSEQMLAFMGKQIQDMKANIPGPLPGTIPINTKTPCIQTADSFLRHDLQTESMRPYLKEGNHALKGDALDGNLDNEKMEFFAGNFRFEDFSPPGKHPS